MAFRIPDPTPEQDAQRVAELARAGKSPTGPLLARIQARAVAAPAVVEDADSVDPSPVVAEPVAEAPAAKPSRRR